MEHPAVSVAILPAARSPGFVSRATLRRPRGRRPPRGHLDVKRSSARRGHGVRGPRGGRVAQEGCRSRSLARRGCGRPHRRDLGERPHPDDAHRRRRVGARWARRGPLHLEGRPRPDAAGACLAPSRRRRAKDIPLACTGLTAPSARVCAGDGRGRHLGRLRLPRPWAIRRRVSRFRHRRPRRRVRETRLRTRGALARRHPVRWLSIRRTEKFRR
jgi:hypothetical protein